MLTTTRRAHKPRQCGQPIKPGDLIECTTTPPGRHDVLNNQGWLRSMTHADRCPPGPTAAYPVGPPSTPGPGRSPNSRCTPAPALLRGNSGPATPSPSVDGHAGGSSSPTCDRWSPPHDHYPPLVPRP